jgi:hypothetical protein
VLVTTATLNDLARQGGGLLEAELLALEVVLLLSVLLLLLLLVLLALLEVVLEAEVLVLERVADVEPEVVVSVPVPTYGNSSL